MRSTATFDSFPASKMQMLRLMVAHLLFGATFCLAQSATQNSVSCELPNNTSASPDYRGSHANIRAANVSKLPIRSLLYEGAETRIYTRFMPWFGDAKHRDLGYRSDEPRQVSRQVSDMRSRGIDGAIVDWYGPKSGSKNESTILLMHEAERQNFEFAISEDAGSLGDCQKRGCNVTDQLISDLTYAAEHFENSSAYVRFQDRPAVFFFGLEKYPIDWRRVRESLPLRPLFFFRNSGTFANPDADGAYSWLAPETVSSSDPMAMQYLERFYSKAQASDKIAMGSAYKGFDDAEASWGKGRVIDAQCGLAWLATFALVGHFYSSRHQLPALIIPTWNDYEEGTEIESGIDNCVSVRASISEKDLSWSISGRENTLDHVAILAHEPYGWAEIQQRPGKSGSIELRDLHLESGTTTLCVQAIGKPSFVNHSSGPLPLNESSKPGREFSPFRKQTARKEGHPPRWWISWPYRRRRWTRAFS